jgi:hypothetical protein
MFIQQLYPVASNAAYSTATASYSALDSFKVTAFDFWPCSGVWPAVCSSGTAVLS